MTATLTPSPATPPLVLIVDDDEDSAALLGICVEREGYRVVVASTLAQARVALAEQTIDVAVVDVHLSDGDGTSIFSEGRPPSVRVALVMSGSRGVLASARLQGFDGFLDKPIDRKRLLGLIRELSTTASLRGPHAAR